MWPVQVTHKLDTRRNVAAVRKYWSWAIHHREAWALKNLDAARQDAVPVGFYGVLA